MCLMQSILVGLTWGGEERSRHDNSLVGLHHLKWEKAATSSASSAAIHHSHHGTCPHAVPHHVPVAVSSRHQS